MNVSSVSGRASPDGEAAIRHGLLLFPKPGEKFLNRRGQPTSFHTDARCAGSRLALRSLILRRFRKALKGTAFDVIAGVAKAGMPWAAWLSMQTNKPYVTVLIDPEPHPDRPLVEGDVRARKVLLVDNFNVTGGTLLKAAEHVAAAGGEPVAVALVIRHERAPVALPTVGAFSLGELLVAGVSVGQIDQARLEAICQEEGLI
jgi:orotate phosphoribosyltransferase